jgi:hypothetical protein
MAPDGVKSLKARLAAKKSRAKEELLAAKKHEDAMREIARRKQLEKSKTGGDNIKKVGVAAAARNKAAQLPQRGMAAGVKHKNKHMEDFSKMKSAFNKRKGRLLSSPHPSIHLHELIPTSVLSIRGLAEEAASGQKLGRRATAVSDGSCLCSEGGSSSKEQHAPANHSNSRHCDKTSSILAHSPPATAATTRRDQRADRQAPTHRSDRNGRPASDQAEQRHDQISISFS